jgi:hypothetical protein
VSCQYYNLSGYVRVWDKVVDTTKQVVIDYTLMGIAGVIFLAGKAALAPLSLSPPSFVPLAACGR